ncbi:unnamed protein product [Notodromas monacha]|uniref:PIH1 domain-containing protein 1 n=1 Tax=Notodromas monacha TaxID=399045 RepID=A0A7R9BGB0_9CRUS|nr:unnamed protein product [Notodromas monacha]CAG0914925.1 unnamed protein product [Notodromas monacha]
MSQTALTKFYNTRRCKAEVIGKTAKASLKESTLPMNVAAVDVMTASTENQPVVDRRPVTRALGKAKKSAPGTSDIRKYMRKQESALESSHDQITSEVDVPKEKISMSEKRHASSANDLEDGAVFPKRFRKLTPVKETPERKPIAGCDENSPLKLKKFRNVMELKARLAQLNEKTRKLEENRGVPELSPDCKASNTVTLTVPSSSAGFSVSLSPNAKMNQNKNTEAIPAFKRYKHLLQDAPEIPMSTKTTEECSSSMMASHAVELPVACASLLESFKALDMIVFLLINRKDVPIYFEKVKAKVRQLSGRVFNEATLGRICAVFPNAFDLAVEEIEVLEMAGKKKAYHLILRPKYGTNPVDGLNHRVAAEILKERLSVMKQNLMKYVLTKHEAFLSTLASPLTVNPSEVKRWHPEFHLDQVIPPDPVELPKKPVAARPATANEVLLQASRNLFDACPRMVSALQKTRDASEPPKNDNPQKCETPLISSTNFAINKPVPKELKKFSSNLLEKIRAREAQKNVRSMLRSDDEEKRLKQLQRLPDLARIAHNIFVSERKDVIPLDVVVDRISYSYTGALSKGDIRKHVELLTAEMKGVRIQNSVGTGLPEDWIQIISSSEGAQFIRLDKRSDLKVVVNTLLEKVKAATAFYMEKLDFSDTPSFPKQLLLNSGDGGEALVGELSDLRLPSKKIPERTALKIAPVEGFCIKCKVVGAPAKSKGKVFVNMMHCSEIPEPGELLSSATDEKLVDILESSDGDVSDSLRVPMSMGSPRDEKDKSGEHCKACDVVINSKFFEKISNSLVMKTFLITVTLDGLDQKYGFALDRDDWIILKNKKYCGTKADHIVQDTLVKEVHEPFMKKPDPEAKTDFLLREKITRPLKSEDSPRKTPVHEFRRKADVLLAKVELPCVDSSAEVQLEMNDDRIMVTTNEYLLDVYLPVVLDFDKSEAFFDVKSRQLPMPHPAYKPELGGDPGSANYATHARGSRGSAFNGLFIDRGRATVAGNESISATVG